MSKDVKKGVSRRSFLTTSAGAVATGAALIGGGGIVKSIIKPKLAHAEDVGFWPYPVGGLDVDLVRFYGKEGYYSRLGGAGGCGYGGAIGLIYALREALPGSVWDDLPDVMFKYGSGGAAGWGTLCGSLNGALAVMTLACSSGDVRDDLMGWYTTAVLPTDRWNEQDFLANYDPEGYEYASSVADSPLCHISVSTWGKIAGVLMNEAGKKARCSRVTGDTCAKAAELLNAYAAGSYLKEFTTPEEYAHCLECHDAKNGVLHDQQGKMNCVQCHKGDYTGSGHYSNKK